jgi:hypothetical protein
MIDLILIAFLIGAVTSFYLDNKSEIDEKADDIKKLLK